MSLQEIKDRVPTNVLSNGAIRYGVYDENNNLLRYEYMKREDEPMEEGTNINRALLRNLQGDLYTQDRYNELEMHRRMVPVDYETNLVYSEENHIGDCIPKVWTATDSTNLVYVSEDGTKVYASSKDGSYTPDKACDGDEETFWHANTYGSDQHLTIEFVNPIRIKKIKVAARLYSPSWSVNFYIWGSNDNQNWTTLATTSTPLVTNPSLKEINIESVVAYKYFRFATAVYGKQTCVIHELQVTEYSTDVVYGKYEYYSNLDIPITAYEEGKIVNARIGRIALTETHTDNILPENIDTSSHIIYEGADGVRAEVSSYDANANDIRYLFPNKADYKWRSDEGLKTANIIVKIPKKVKINTFSLIWSVASGYESTTTKKLYASKDGVNWSEILDITGTTINIPTPDYYLFYKIEFVYSGDSNYFCVYATNFKTISYTTEYIEEFDNVVLNINNLGYKSVPSCKYGDMLQLAYKNGKWDFINNVIYGTYSGDGTNGQHINFGKKPKIVLVGSLSDKYFIVLFSNTYLGSNTLASDYTLMAKIDNGYGIITEDGFSVIGKGSTNYGFNNSKSIYKYIAIF